MGWTKIEPLERRTRNYSREPDVRVAISRIGREGAQMALLVTVRAKRIGAPLAEWWAKGKSVSALLGTGEHAGRLRLSAGNEHKLVCWGGRNGTVPSPVVRLPLPAGVAPMARKGEPATFEIHGNDLIVNLPAWAVAPSDGQKAPFRMISTAPDHLRARA